MMGPSLQRRKEPRFSAQVRTEILAASQDGAENTVPCRVLDLSRHGICFEAARGVFESGVISKVRFEFPRTSPTTLMLRPLRQRPSAQGGVMYAAGLLFDR